MRDEDMIFSEMAAEADEERAAEDAYAEQCAKDELERQAHGDDLIVRSDLVVIYDEPDPMGLVDLSKCEGKHARFMLMAMARQRGDRMLGGYTEEVVRALLAAHPELMKRNDDPFEGVA